jgi:hypothetical protein
MGERVLRVKMRVAEVLHSKDADGSVLQERVKLIAVYAEKGANAEWSRVVPSANFEIYIQQPSAMKKLSRGNEFWVDFTPVK